MSRVRLYLTSKINTVDDVSLLKPADHKPASSSKQERKECGLNGDEIKSDTLSKLEDGGKSFLNKMLPMKSHWLLTRQREKS